MEAVDNITGERALLMIKEIPNDRDTYEDIRRVLNKTSYNVISAAKMLTYIKERFKSDVGMGKEVDTFIESIMPTFETLKEDDRKRVENDYTLIRNLIKDLETANDSMLTDFIKEMKDKLARLGDNTPLPPPIPSEPPSYQSLTPPPAPSHSPSPSPFPTSSENAVASDPTAPLSTVASASTTSSAVHPAVPIIAPLSTVASASTTSSAVHPASFGSLVEDLWYNDLNNVLTDAIKLKEVAKKVGSYAGSVWDQFPPPLQSMVDTFATSFNGDYVDHFVTAYDAARLKHT